MSRVRQRTGPTLSLVEHLGGASTQVAIPTSHTLPFYYLLVHAEEHQRIADILEQPFLPDNEVMLLKRFRAWNTQLKLEHLTAVHHCVLYDLYFKFPLIPAKPDYIPLPPLPYSHHNRFQLSRLQSTCPCAAPY